MTVHQDDQHIYDEVGAAFAPLRAPVDVDAVMARGRVLRRHRRTMPALAAGVITVAVGLGMMTTGQSAAGPTAAGTAAKTPGVTSLNVDVAAYSVHTDAHTGVITVTFKQLSGQSAATVEQLFLRAGIAVDIQTYRSAATGRHELTPPCTPPTGVHSLKAPGVITEEGDFRDAFSFAPAAMPRGSVLGIGFYWSGDEMVQPMMSLSVFSADPGSCVLPNGPTDIGGRAGG